MDVTINITVPAAIRGYVNPGLTTLTLTDAHLSALDATEREILASWVDAGGRIREDRPYVSGTTQRASISAVTSVETLLDSVRSQAEMVRVHDAELVEQREAYTRAVDHILSIDRDDAMFEHGYWVVPPDLPSVHVDREPRCAQLYAYLRAKQAHASAVAHQTRGMEEYRGRAINAARETAKRAHLDAWVAVPGREELATQWSEQLLCRDELLTMLAGEVLDPIGEEFDVAVCEDRGHACGERKVTCVPRRLYPTFRAFRDRVRAGGGTITQLYRETPCLRAAMDREPYLGEDERGDELGNAHYTADVSVACGPFTFERRVEIRPRV